jgi:CubicO group peptidase (beta-lactamase class C family)
MKKYIYIIVFLSILQMACNRSESNSEVVDEIASIENGLIKPLHIKGDSIETFSIPDRMAFHKVPGISIAVVRNGTLQWAKAYGLANTTDSTEVTKSTLFQAGSISKPIAALAALKLYEENKVDLDTDVNTYLKNWKVEENEFTKKEKVTLRRLLTHTAGMTVHGFPGYRQTDTFPTINEVLDGNGNTPRIYVDTPPDSIWRYSGGGYTVMEKVVEDISGLPLEKYMKTNILQPLEMNSSTYEQPLPRKYHDKASAAYDSQGRIIEGLWHNYPEQAAAGLWTTPTDLARYCIAIQEIAAGKSVSVLSKETIGMMLTRHKNDWGLGPALASKGDSLRFQHGGKNEGFTNNMIAFANTGDAVIVMTNADNGGALIGEILRSASNYYQWEFARQRIVELADPETYNIEKFLGKYLYTDKVPGIGDYIVELTREDKKIIVVDPNNGDNNIMYAMDSLHFIDLNNGDEMIFNMKEDQVEFTWNNNFKFQKLEELDLE